MLTRARLLRLGALAATAALLVPQSAAAAAPRCPSPQVIAHRGASGYRPENTLAAYRLAIHQRADYVEVDVVPTKDGVLVARGDNEISQTTDVADHPEFADRHATKTIDGASVTGWFTEDFTLRELKTLRAKERLPALRPGNTAYDGKLTIPTLQQAVAAIRRHAGIYIEMKHPTYFRSRHLALEPRVALALRQGGLAHRGARVYVQSFEPSSLQRLRRWVDVTTVQGLDVAGRPYDFTASGDTRTYADLRTPAGLAWVRTYADAVAANMNLVVPRDATNHVLPPTSLVQDAHRAGLRVQAWTFRAENFFLPADYQVGPDPAGHGNLKDFLRLVYLNGVDGVFSEFPDIAVAARESGDHRAAAA
jgi:glycerophosphoryl diester phosphodiesterase